MTCLDNSSWLLAEQKEKEMMQGGKDE